MLERGYGKIIFTASLLSFQGGINVPGYAASKSGLAGLTRALASEWAPRGLNVNAIAPGYIETDNTQATAQRPGTPEHGDRRPHPGRTLGRSRADLGGAAVFLASASSDYVHGVVLPVDGGWLEPMTAATRAGPLEVIAGSDSARSSSSTTPAMLARSGTHSSAAACRSPRSRLRTPGALRAVREMAGCPG